MEPFVRTKRSTTTVPINSAEAEPESLFDLVNHVISEGTTVDESSYINRHTRARMISSQTGFVLLLLPLGTLVLTDFRTGLVSQLTLSFQVRH